MSENPCEARECVVSLWNRYRGRFCTSLFSYRGVKAEPEEQGSSFAQLDKLEQVPTLVQH